MADETHVTPETLIETHLGVASPGDLPGRVIMIEIPKISITIGNVTTPLWHYTHYGTISSVAVVGRSEVLIFLADPISFTLTKAHGGTDGVLHSNKLYLSAKNSRLVFEAKFAEGTNPRVTVPKFLLQILPRR